METSKNAFKRFKIDAPQHVACNLININEFYNIWIVNFDLIYCFQYHPDGSQFRKETQYTTSAGTRLKYIMFRIGNCKKPEIVCIIERSLSSVLNKKKFGRLNHNLEELIDGDNVQHDDQKQLTYIGLTLISLT